MPILKTTYDLCKIAMAYEKLDYLFGHLHCEDDVHMQCTYMYVQCTMYVYVRMYICIRKHFLWENVCLYRRVHLCTSMLIYH